MKREKRLTKRERKALQGPRPGAAAAHQHDHHIHCVACGRHLDEGEFHAVPASAKFLRCAHGSQFAACAEHEAQAKLLLDTHDRTGQPVQSASAWH